MKPTESQIKIAQIVKYHAIFWQITNDINSPTHFTEITSDVMNLEFDGVKMTKAQEDELNKHLDNLYIFIKTFNS